MKKFTLRHEINCSAEHFWKVFFDKDFNTTLFLEQLGFPEYVILEQDEGDKQVHRRVRGRPKMDMPKPVMKLLGDSFGYEEVGTLERATGVWSWKLKPNTLEGKLLTGGEVRVEKIDDKRCRRVADMHCEAKVFGLGGLLESSTEKEMRSGWDKSAAYMNKWLADHPPE
jgi:hypothetical protein